MLINLRNAMMTGRRLPYDAEVEFLQSTGTQWIDTGVLADSLFGFEITCAFLADGCVYGTVNGNSAGTAGIDWARYQFGRRYNVSGNNTLFYGFNNIDTSSWLKIALDCTAVHTYQVFDGEFFVDGERKVYGTSGSFTAHPFYLFASLSQSLGYTLSASSRLYSAKLWNGSTLVRDYIPVRKGTVGYLYDRVSGKLFGNAGSGDFVLGQDVVPVEWLGCDGSQYIDTKVVATNSHGFRVDIEAAKKAVDVNTRIFGAHEGNVRCGFALYGEPPSDDYFWGWNEATGFRATIPQRFVVSLNYKNDRAAIFNGTTNLSQLGTLGSMTQSVYLLNANYGNAPFANQFVVGKFYGAEITVGSDVANHYIPIRVGTEGAMMDVLTRRIYRNKGTGAFSCGNDLKYPIPAE